MKFLRVLTILSILVLIALPIACEKQEAPKADAEKPSKVLDLNEVTTVAIVKDIDLPNRLFTLEYSEGNVMVVEAAPDLEGIENIHVGDKVKITYLTSTAVYVQSPDEDRKPVEKYTTIQVDSKDGKPRKLTVEITEKTSTVEAIDVENRKATLKDAQGNVETIDVADDVQNLENVKVGDQVVYQVTQTLAVDIKKVEE